MTIGPHGITSHPFRVRNSQTLSDVQTEGFTQRMFASVIHAMQRTAIAPLQVPAHREPSFQNIFGRYDSATRLTRAGWESYEWNPEPKDPNASDKPSWDVFLGILRRIDLWNRRLIAETTRPQAETAVARFGEEAITVEGRTLHVGPAGRMAGLIHFLEAASRAGARMPLIVMRDHDNAAVSLHLQESVGDMLGVSIHRDNIIESCHNIIMERYAAQARIADNPELDISTREAAAEAALGIVDAYESHMDTEIEKFDPHALPADLPTLKDAYGELIEAAAMQRVKEIKGAKTQQGVDVPAACVDMAKALEEVSQECAFGVQAVEDATDTDAAKAAYDAAVVKIEAVTPLNTPVWDLGAASYAANPPDAVQIAGSEVTVICKHPPDVEIPGKVTLAVQAGAAVAITRIAPSDTTLLDAAVLKVALSSPVAGETIALDFTGRNLCGPSVLRVELTAEDPNP